MYCFFHDESNMTLDKQAKIVIVGGGTFGLSTALWLVRNNYQNVTVIDLYDIPSNISAANDVNKIIQSSYTDEFHENLARESLELWKSDEVFKNQFHEVGIIYSSVSEESLKELNDLNDRRIKSGRSKLKFFETKSDFQGKIPELKGPLEGWKGFYQEDECGWAHAKNSLISAANEFLKLGGQIKVGNVDQLIFKDGKVTGCLTNEGIVYESDKLIISAGASSINIFNFQNQMLAKCWTFAHIKLTDEEASMMKNIPVLLNYDLGFFFEPDSNNEIKICNEFPGYTNYTTEDSTPESSIPIAKDSIPLEAEHAIRNLFRATLPQFADREFVKKKICWCTDTPDRFFLIDEHPDYNGSLIFATGDSGHGFKFMPVIGKYISKLVINGKDKVDPETFNHWRWRPETSKDRLHDRYGGDGQEKDLKQISKWV